MKKFLSLFLVLTMVLSMLTLPTFAETVGDAAGTPTPTTSVLVKDIADGVTTVNHEGVTYTVVRDLAGLKKIGAGGNYILAKDIDCGSSALGASTIPLNNDSTDFTLEGNGHTITVKVDINGGGQGLFGTIPKKAIAIVIRNITFNVSGQLRNNSTGVLFGTANNHADSSVTFEKVIMNCNDLKYTSVYQAGVYHATADGKNEYWQGMQGAGLFYAKVRSAATFTDCLLTGSFTSTSNSNEMGVGGFVGLIDCSNDETVSFTRCKATNGSFTTTNNQSSCNGVFVGKMNSGTVTLTFDDCEIASDYEVQIVGGGSVTLKGTYTVNSETKTKTKNLSGNKAGGFVANAANAKAISFNDCRVGGDWTFKGNQSAPFVGYATAPCAFANCSFIGNLNASGGKSAAFIGNGNKAFTFDNCYFNGSLTSTGSQSGGFVGCIDNPGTAMFDSCEADAAVYAMNNRIAFFVGQAYTSGKATLNGVENQTVYMKECTATGTLISSSNWEGAFVSVASGSYNKIGQEATVTFDGCTANVFMVANDSVAAYVGSNGNGTAHLNFKNCTNNATVYSVSSAGAWVAELLKEYPLTSGTTVASTISVDNDCTNNAKVYSVTLFEGDTTAAYTEITAEQIASGEYAYMIAQAQAAASVDAKYVYGQTIGTDAKPKLGGAAVEIVTTAKGETVYANGIYTVPYDENTEYIQMTPVVSNKRNARVIIAVAEADLAEIKTVTITFTLADETTKTFTVEKNDIDSYYAVWAGGEIAEAAEGYVLLAVAIKNIPVGTEGANWNVTGNEVQDVVVTVA